jgi:hypothetical protein
MVTNLNATTMSRSRSSKKGDDSSKWLTRNQAADLLGVSQMTLLALERREQLHPRRVMRIDNGGHQRMLYVYDPQELAALPYRARSVVHTPGEIAARAFELFNEGRLVSEVVVELRQSPDDVEILREKWFNSGGANFVITPGVKLELEKIVGPFADVIGLLELVTAKVPKPT